MSTTTIIILAAIVLLALLIFAVYIGVHHDIQVLQRNLEAHKETITEGFNYKFYLLREEYLKMQQRIDDLEHHNDIEDLVQ